MNSDITGIYLAISFVAALAIGLWIYGDAQQRQLQKPFIWGTVGFLFGLIGIILYWLMIIRPNKHGKA